MWSLPLYKVPVKTQHLYTNYSMLDQRLRRRSNIVSMLYKCFVFTVVVAATL